MTLNRAFFISSSAAAAMLLGGATRVGHADEPVGSTVRYNREVVRIFEHKCVTCHSAQDGLAMPLASFSDVRSWARPIREEILERRMPPWPAAAGVKPLANELSLTIREIVILTSWIDGGTQRGDPADLPPAKPTVMWPAGEPDVKLALPEQQVTLDDRPSVVRVDVPLPAGGDMRWLRGFDVAPGARPALRSLMLYAKTPGGERWLGAWTPWYAMTKSPEGAAHQIPAGATVIAELHYKGWAEREPTVGDRSVLGLYFERQPTQAPIQELDVATVTPASRRAGPSGPADSRPSGAADKKQRQRLRGEAVLNADATVWAIRPRLERGGIAAEGTIEVSAWRPDGAIEPLLWVKDNRPDWQLPYVLREPVTLPRGTRVVLTAYSADDAGKSSASVLWYPAPAMKTATARPSAPPPPR